MISSSQNVCGYIRLWAGERSLIWPYSIRIHPRSFQRSFAIGHRCHKKIIFSFLFISYDWIESESHCVVDVAVCCLCWRRIKTYNGNIIHNLIDIWMAVCREWVRGCRILFHFFLLQFSCLLAVDSHKLVFGLSTVTERARERDRANVVKWRTTYVCASLNVKHINSSPNCVLYGAVDSGHTQRLKFTNSLCVKKLSKYWNKLHGIRYKCRDDDWRIPKINEQTVIASHRTRIHAHDTSWACEIEIDMKSDACYQQPTAGNAQPNERDA